ncbi:MAG: isocitrate lyase/PEP mutase family protein [Gaiellaceae bacterium]
MASAELADRLRALHGSPPLVLANVWDAASARLVEEVGFPAVATSSAAVAAVHGAADADSMDVDVAFGAVAEIAAAVSVPVTADVEAGYGLDPDAFAERLLAAGAVGCNLEDTAHHGGGVLVPAEAQAERLRAVKQAAQGRGVDVVLNARVDTYLRSVDDPVAETIRRGRLYLDAGADCVYPIFLSDLGTIRELVAELGTVNVLLRPGGPTVAELADAGVARVSVGSGLFKLAQASLREAAAELLRSLPPA